MRRAGLKTLIGAGAVTLAGAAGAIAGSVPASAATAAPAACSIAWHATLVSGNAGHLTLNFTSTCGNSVAAEVKCEANNGSSSTYRFGGYRTTPGTSTAGCFNGSYPQHGWMYDRTTAQSKQVF